MLGVGAALLAMAAAARLAYPRRLERRHARRFTLNNGVISGAEAIELDRDGARSVLLLHGGGDTPQSVAQLARHLYEVGFAVHAPLLSGHGRALSAFSSVSADRWYADVESSHARLADRYEDVSIVGSSMGGALAASLCANHTTVSSLVLLAPYLAMPPVLRSLAGARHLWAWLAPYVSSQHDGSILDPQAARRSLGYGLWTPAAIYALRAVVDRGYEALPSVRAPTLVIQSRRDNRIAAASAEHAFSRLGAAEKEVVWLDGAGHVITVDYGHERVFELTAGWLTRHDARRPGLTATTERARPTFRPNP